MFHIILLIYNIIMKLKSLLFILFILFIFLIAICYKTFSISALQDSRRIDGIVEPVYTQDCFPRTLKQSGVTKICFEHANLGQNIFCSSGQIKKIEEYYKKGQDKDLLNDGSGQFCAE